MIVSDSCHVGQIIRLLIKNSKNSKRTQKKEIKEKFKIKNVDSILKEVNEKLNIIGLCIVGFKGMQMADYKNSDKYFIVKSNQEDFGEGDEGEIKRRKIEILGDDVFPVTHEFESLIVILTLLFLENNKIIYSTLLKVLERVQIHEETVSEFKRMGYLCTFKEDDDVFVSVSWRYYAEFPDFDPVAYFKCVND